jgi:hypothetical protein
MRNQATVKEIGRSEVKLGAGDDECDVGTDFMPRLTVLSDVGLPT